MMFRLLVAAAAVCAVSVSATVHPNALACTVTNVTKGIFQISSTGTDDVGARRQCVFTFSDAVANVTQIGINHCTACKKEGTASVDCQCHCTSISCHFVSKAEVVAPMATNATCSCSH